MNDIEFRKRIDALLKYFDIRIEQTEQEARRFYDAGQMSSGHLWEGTCSGFRDSKIATEKILLEEKPEVEQ